MAKESTRSSSWAVKARPESWGASITAAFAVCSVRRTIPCGPADYVPLDAIWSKFGYVRHPELQTTYSWKDVDQVEETAKPMIFWMKALTTGESR